MADLKKAELIRREAERKSNDEIKVHNPTDQDYYVKEGGYNWKVPAQGDLICTRHLAMMYITHMIDKMILDESKEIVEKARKKYNGPFWPAEEERIALRTNNPDLRKKYLPQLWKGVVRKFGLDEMPKDETGNAPESTAPQDEQLLEELGLEEEKDVSKELAKDMEENTAEDFAKSISEEL